jgi:hypothetical protein
MRREEDRVCPACLASLAVLLSGGVFTAFLAARSLPVRDLEKSPTEPNGEENEHSEDHLAG